MFPSYRSQICRANQLIGFYMMGTLVVKGLISRFSRNVLCYCELTFIQTNDVVESLQKNKPVIRVSSDNAVKTTSIKFDKIKFPNNSNFDMVNFFFIGTILDLVETKDIKIFPEYVIDLNKYIHHTLQKRHQRNHLNKTLVLNH